MNGTTCMAFFDELEKLGLNPFAIAGERALIKTPAKAIAGQMGHLGGQAGNIEHAIVGSEAVVKNQGAQRAAHEQLLQKMMNEGKFDPAQHDVQHFLHTGTVAPKKAPFTPKINPEATTSVRTRTLPNPRATRPTGATVTATRSAEPAAPSTPPGWGSWMQKLKRPAIGGGLMAAGGAGGYAMSNQPAAAPAGP
jgi:hypothetical protein